MLTAINFKLGKALEKLAASKTRLSKYAMPTFNTQVLDNKYERLLEQKPKVYLAQHHFNKGQIRVYLRRKIKAKNGPALQTTKLDLAKK